MSKLPWMKFCPGDFMQDTITLSLQATGAWIKILCAMWRKSERGKLTLSMDGFSRLFGATIHQTEKVLDELASKHICDMSRGNSVVITLKRQRFSRPAVSIWKIIRDRIFRRDDYTCQYCGARGVRLECDHIIPVSRGGKHVDENLNTACFNCNRSKRAKMLKEWSNKNQ